MLCRHARRAWSLPPTDRKSTRLNSSHVRISYAVFCLKKKKKSQKSNHSRPNHALICLETGTYELAYHQSREPRRRIDKGKRTQTNCVTILQHNSVTDK